MRLALIIIYVFFISAAGLTAQSAVCDDILYGDINSLYGWVNPLLTYDHGGTKRFDYFDDKWIKLAGTGYHSIYARAEIFAMDSGRDGELANNPDPNRNSYYDEVVSWIKDAYHAWVAKNQYGSPRLLLLCFGLVGIIGIRRKFKKN